MRIFVLSPFGKTEPFGRRNLEKVARPDTDFAFECLEAVFPLPYNTYVYNTLKCVNAAVERIVKAEQEGYDAAVISCMLDPGLMEARAIVDIPVTATFEASAHVAAMMGKRFSVVSTDPMTVGGIDMRLVDLYGVRQKVASLRWIGITACDLYPEITPTEEVAERTVEVSKRCVQEDQAEVIVPGCTIIGALLTNYFAEDPVELIGAPVIDPMIVAFKQAEMMAEMCKMTGYPAASRAGFYRKPPIEETRELRKFMRDNRSPEQYYQQ
jgi:allantoin racemase